VGKLFNAVRVDVMAGESVASALARHPRAFSPLYRGLVAAGVEAGTLPDVLRRLADYLEARQALRQRFITALIYPAFVTAIALMVVTVLLVYVVPQVVSVYQQGHQTLPWLTLALIATSDFLRVTGMYWLIAACVIVMALLWAMRGEAFRRRVHALWLRTPLIARLTRGLDAARFASTLAILAGSGTPLMRALDAASEVVRMLPIKDAARATTALVREGVPLARALKEQAVFPPVLIHMVASGETSGQLAPMLERAAAELEAEAERRLAWITALVQPALIVGMGALVLLLVLAVMLPIVSMNQLIR
jgi:general secretion pathway protein F